MTLGRVLWSPGIPPNPDKKPCKPRVSGALCWFDLVGVRCGASVGHDIVTKHRPERTHDKTKASFRWKRTASVQQEVQERERWKVVCRDLASAHADSCLN